jgi:hypothetical protein
MYEVDRRVGGCAVLLKPSRSFETHLHLMTGHVEGAVKALMDVKLKY